MYGNFSESALNAVASMFDFTRCVRPDGSVYGTSGRCRKGTETGAKAKAKASGGSPQKSLAERMAAAAERLEKASPKPQKAQTAAAKVARPVDPKVAAKVDKAMAAKAKGPAYTPEQLAAQDKLLAQAQAQTKAKSKPKKPKETPEQKAEKKWLAEKEKVEGIQAEHEKLKAELKAKGVKVFATGSGADMLHRMLKERGIPTESQLSRMQLKLRQTEPERLKQERIAAEKERIAAEISGTSREKRKGMIREELERLKGNAYIRTLKDVNNNVEMMKKWIESDPTMATLKNRVALTAMRALRAQMVREARREKEEKSRSLDEALQESPRYDKTPGSREPMKAKYDESGPPQERLEKIYAAQGFNAKPELVRRRADLESRQDILRDSEGGALILYRGVSEERFARQFQGSGPDGDLHYPGKGIYGNGTYAASAGGNPAARGGNPEDNPSETAQRTAISYASGSEGSRNRVTAFALRSDANIVQFEGGTVHEREVKYDRWRKDTLQDASERFGVQFYDIGEAAAAMGIHAYRFPMNNSEDYWIILNRGAVIAAQDPELPGQ